MRTGPLPSKNEHDDTEATESTPVRTRTRTRTRVRLEARDAAPQHDHNPNGGKPADVDDADDPDLDNDDGQPGTLQLQLSWHQGRLIAWVAGRNAGSADVPEIRARLKEVGADPDSWTEHRPVPLPNGTHAPALSAPLPVTLGWIAGLGGTAGDERLGVSVTWLGLATALAVRLVADGRMVPQLEKVADAAGNRSKFAVRWVPTLIEHEDLTGLSKSMPTSVTVFDRRTGSQQVTSRIISGMVDAICTDAAARVEVPAPPPQPRTTADVSEAVLTRLDGSVFEASHQAGTEVAKVLKQWARGVIGDAVLKLIVQLDPPDQSNAWHLKTLVDINGKLDRAEAVMSRSKHNRKEAIKRELERLEGLYPPLARSRSSRRGEVLLGQDEAWELMTEVGPVLASAGFDVRVPPLSPRKARPSLRVASSGDSTVGAQQLTAVQWSAVFDDVELTAEDLQELAKQARPLVKSHGRWVAVDHADIEAAAAALAERANKKQMTGADMLRYALGLDGTAMGQPVSVGGSNWAADLLKSARSVPENPPTSPDGFEGELRTYQADAAAWLRFLDDAGLGGCLALDMGLGKTPTVLAHLVGIKGRGPALVIAPPAVVGNWTAEAARFVPDLKVLVHHGAGRTESGDLADEIDGVDVLLTTYGTAVRDIDALEKVEWVTVVLDEGQVIKNPASDTAQQLRRLQSHMRLILTGTPIENGLGDLWALMDFVNPGLVGDRTTFIAQMTAATEAGKRAESALAALNGVLVFRRTKAEPVIAAELPDRIDELDHCPMTAEQVGLYQAVLDELVVPDSEDRTLRKGAILAAITALKQVCNHPAAYTGDDKPLDGRSGKLTRLEEIVDNVFDAGERMLIFTHFATWGERLADHLTKRTGVKIGCYHGGLSRTARDRLVAEFQAGKGAGALVLSLKAGGTGLNLTAASHVVLYDRWWNPAVEDQARDRAWRIGQTQTVIAHRLVCPGTVDERVEEVVAGKRRIAALALPKSSSVGDLDARQLQQALGLDPDLLLTEETLGGVV